MILTIALAYVIVGFIVALVAWWAVFHKDFDQYVRDYHGEEPPTTSEKWFVISTLPIMWPYALWKGFLSV